MPHDIFVSYSRRDLAAVKPIKEELEAAGFSCWMDLDGIESGSEEFTDKIATAIEESSTTLFFLSDGSQKSRWSLNELRVARDEGKHVILVRFNDDRMTIKFKLEFGGSDIIDWRVSEQKEKLLRDLREWTGMVKNTTAPPVRPMSGQDADAEIATAHNAISRRFFEQRRFKESAEAGKMAASLYRGLSERCPGRYRDELRLALYNEGSALLELKQFNEAETLLRKALAIAESLAHDESPQHLSDLADTVNRLGTLHRISGRKSLAVVRNEWERALSLRRRLSDLDPVFKPSLADSLNNLGELNYETDQRTNAKQAWEEALAIYRDLSARNPGCYEHGVAKVFVNLVGLRREMGEIDALIRDADEAVRLLRPLAEMNSERFSISLAGALYNRSFASVDRGRWEEAEQYLGEAFDLSRICAERNPKTDESFFRDVWERSFEVFSETKNHSEAVRMMTRVVSLYRELGGPNNNVFREPLARSLFLLGRMQFQIGNTDSSEQCLKEARVLYQALSKQVADGVSSAARRDWAEVLWCLAMLHNDHGRPDEARRELDEARRLNPKETERFCRQFGIR